MFAPIISGEDLITHIYKDALDKVSRNDPTVIARAIAAGIGEAKLYLSRYDLVQLFGDETDNVAATFSDEILTSLVKDIICWHVIKLGNPNIDTEKKRQAYEDAMKTLKDIQKGLANPKWPYFDTTDQTAPPSDQVTIQSNPLRNNYY